MRNESNPASSAARSSGGVERRIGHRLGVAESHVGPLDRSRGDGIRLQLDLTTRQVWLRRTWDERGPFPAPGAAGVQGRSSSTCRVSAGLARSRFVCTRSTLSPWARFTALRAVYQADAGPLGQRSGLGLTVAGRGAQPLAYSACRCGPPSGACPERDLGGCSRCLPPSSALDGGGAHCDAAPHTRSITVPNHSAGILPCAVRHTCGRRSLDGDPTVDKQMNSCYVVLMGRRRGSAPTRHASNCSLRRCASSPSAATTAHVWRRSPARPA